MIPLLVLAGGFGTRLSGILSGKPKALAPVAGTPFLVRQISNWIAQGVDSFIFLLHHESSQIIDVIDGLKVTSLKNCDVKYIVEPIALGTGGAVSNAVIQLNLVGELLVTNADTWLQGGINALIKSGADSILAVKQKDRRRFGGLLSDDNGFIISFSEKISTSNQEGWINAGTYILGAEHFFDWSGDKESIEMDLFPRLVREKKLKSVPVDSEFADIGVPDDYRRFCERFC